MLLKIMLNEFKSELYARFFILFILFIFKFVACINKHCLYLRVSCYNILINHLSQLT